MKTTNIDFSGKEWGYANQVIDFFSIKTNCLCPNGSLLLRPNYVVAVDDDMASAKNAAFIAVKCYKQFGYWPKVLCCGGIGMLSKYLNRQPDGSIISEGRKQAITAAKLGIPESALVVLDSGTNTGANLKEVADVVGNSRDKIIFCPTKRLSLRLERTVANLTVQFPGTQPLNDFWYVPDESLDDMLRLYNGKGIVGGLPLLSEAAALYDRMVRYCGGKFMAKLLKEIPEEIHQAGKYLVKHYPVRVSRIPLSAPLQFGKMYWAVKKNAGAISQDLEMQILKWREELETV